MQNSEWYLWTSFAIRYSTFFIHLLWEVSSNEMDRTHR